MFTCFLFQAICYPLSNLMSTHHRSVQKSYMLGIAWILSILFGIPQLFIYRTLEVEEDEVCYPQFIEYWGKRVSTYSLINNMFCTEDDVSNHLVNMVLYIIIYFFNKLSR